MNDHSMFVRRSTDVHSSIAVFNVININIETAIYHSTAPLGEWWLGRTDPFDLTGKVTYHATLNSEILFLAVTRAADHRIDMLRAVT